MPQLLIILLSLYVLIRSIAFRFDSYTDSCYRNSLSNAPYDVVIIPGSPYDHPKPNQMFTARMLWALQLYRQGAVKHIIFSGSAVHTPYTEGTIMKAISDSMGIPSSVSFAETEALHTDENIYCSFAMAKRAGYVTIAVATDPFQNFFVSRHLKDEYNGIALLPMPMDTFRKYREGNLPAINAAPLMIKNFVPLRERHID